jgi:hypothetical protein
MASFKQLTTRALHNEGAVLNVVGPDGKATGETIRVRGVDSDEFRRVDSASRRDMIRFLSEKGDADKARDSDEFNKFTEEGRLKLQAALIVDWSFEEPCTEDNKLELLREAPYIAKQVDEFAGKRSNFIKASQEPSEPTQSTSST